MYIMFCRYVICLCMEIQISNTYNLDRSCVGLNDTNSGIARPISGRSTNLLKNYR